MKLSQKKLGCLCGINQRQLEDATLQSLEENPKKPGGCFEWPL